VTNRCINISSSVTSLSAIVMGEAWFSGEDPAIYDCIVKTFDGLVHHAYSVAYAGASFKLPLCADSPKTAFSFNHDSPELCSEEPTCMVCLSKNATLLEPSVWTFEVRI
jgi:hypothetical protein